MLQYTGESLGQAEKTELDSGLEELLAQADATKTWTDSIISQTEVLLQPSPGEKLYVYCVLLLFGTVRTVVVLSRRALRVTAGNLIVPYM